jgi:hypothetical protein
MAFNSIAIEHLAQFAQSLPGDTQPRCLADGLSRYWLAVLDRDSFYFRSPQTTRKDFVEAANKRRIEPVLKAVAGGLSLSLPKWLNDLLHD